MTAATATGGVGIAQRVLFRATAERALRRFMDDRGLVEVSTPSLVACPGMEPELRAFALAPHEAIELRGRYLHTSPELAIKATLAAAGVDVFALARCYRDEPPTFTHHPEFTMLEWYRLRAPYERLMDDTEALIGTLLSAVGSSNGAGWPCAQQCAQPSVPSEPLPPPRFARMTVREAFARWVGVDFDAPIDDLAAAAAPLGGDLSWGWTGLFTLLFVERVEPRLAALGPIFVTEFPTAAAALARVCPDDPSVAERFELYLPYRGEALEIANAFGELTDAVEQRERFAADLRVRAAVGSQQYAMPEAALRGIGALPQTAGIAVGWERLLSWLALETRGWEVSVAGWLLGEPLGERGVDAERGEIR